MTDIPTTPRELLTEFPAPLRPLIQQGFLSREFRQAALSNVGYRSCALRHYAAGQIGDTVAVHIGDKETCEIRIRHAASTTDMNMLTNRVGIASQFLQNAYVTGEQAARALSEYARIALFEAYFDNEPAATVLRPSLRKTATELTVTDTLTMATLLDAVARLRRHAVPEIDGAYNCYLDPVSARQLFADSYFQQLFPGACSATQVFRQGMTNDFLGLRFIPVISPTMPHPSGLCVRRVIICGEGALVEGVRENVGGDDIAPRDALVEVIENIAMVVREPIDRLQQIIGQSWCWIAGFAAPRHVETGEYRRAIGIEHIG